MLSIISRFNIVPRDILKSVCNNARRNLSKVDSKIVPKAENYSIISIILKSSGIGVVIGGLYLGYSLKHELATATLPIEKVLTKKSLNSVSKPSDIEYARQIKILGDKSGLDVILFQYPTCPFCCKVRAFLDYYGVSYNVVEVNPVLRQQIKWSEYKKVPILLVSSGKEYLQLNDSTMIISSVTTFLKNKKKISLEQVLEYYPAILDDSTGKSQNILNKYFIMDGKTDQGQLGKDNDERKWRKWADDVLVHTLSPNVYRTKEEAFQAFNWFSEVGEWDRLFSSWEKTMIVYVGAYAMYLIGKKLKKKHQLKNDVRQSLYDECRKWILEVNSRGKFYGGKSPNLADLAVYGVLSSIEGCQAFEDLLKNTNIGIWYDNTKKLVQNHEGLKVL